MMNVDALSFAGCGTLNFYQIGVAFTLQQNGFSDQVHYAGSSAGSGLCVLLAAGHDAESVFTVAKDILAPHQGKNILFHPGVLKEFADQFLDTFIDDSTLNRLGKRVHISITRLNPFGNLMINQFTDRADLCQAIRASCHLPSVKFPSVTFRGQKCIDGGVTRNCPTVGSHCVRVSPFFFDLRMTIKPRHFIPPWWSMIIPSNDRALSLFTQGIQDAEHYLNRGLLRNSYFRTD